MIGQVRTAIYAELRGIKSDICLSASKIGLSAGAAIRAQLAKHPAVRPFMAGVGETIGRMAAYDKGFIREYCAAADLLVPIGRAIFPDYRAFRTRIELIREDTELVCPLTVNQVIRILGALGPNDRLLALKIKHNFIVEQGFNNLARTGEIDPDNPAGGNDTRRLEVEMRLFAATMDRQITPKKAEVIEGSVVMPKKALPKPV